jgi:hypothetical protein
MAKDFTEFSGSLPETQDRFHIAEGGTLRLIDFVVADPNLRKPEHELIIQQKLIPFLLAATDALGPGNYILRCKGFGSATGSFDLNDKLSEARAKNAATFAIRAFEAQAPEDSDGGDREETISFPCRSVLPVSR